MVVPSPASFDALLATSFTIWALRFSYWSSSSISFATVTPSLVTVGALKDFLEDDDAAGGAERDLDGVGEFLNAAEDLLACVVVESNLLGGHIQLRFRHQALGTGHW